ncbi:M23 family metallopeptidase [Candidatus Binatia bacterium]|nr:M23 family metallopeptidase [Candidatus Binatia bacterium]
MHSIDEGTTDFRTLQLDGARNLGGFGGSTGTRKFRRSADGELSAEPVKRPFMTLGDPASERMQSIALVKPLSDVSQVEIFPIAKDGLRVYRGPEFIERHVTVRRGDTFEDLLQLYDIERSEALVWHAGTRATFDLAKLRPGRSLTVFFERESGRVAALEYRIDAMNVLVAERGVNREIRARVARIPSSTDFRVIVGTLETNMAADCAAAGIPARITAELADIYGWIIDFDRMKRGDSFRVVYEVAIGEDGNVVQTGRILAAAIETDGERHTAVLHTAPDGTPGYYDLDGHPLDRGILRSPLEYTRVSSDFSRSRFHPILARNRAHQGVDLAAPHGTPVRAMADGKVTFAGWFGQLGRTVRIEHANGSYESVYGHFSRIASSVEEGRKVRKGEIIGYVGRTGLATGPHLHLELLVDGEHVDPMDLLRPGRRPKLRIAPETVPLEGRQLLLVSALQSVDGDGPVRLTRLSVPFGTGARPQIQ